MQLLLLFLFTTTHDSTRQFLLRFLVMWPWRLERIYIFYTYSTNILSININRLFTRSFRFSMCRKSRRFSVHLKIAAPFAAAKPFLRFFFRRKIDSKNCEWPIDDSTGAKQQTEWNEYSRRQLSGSYQTVRRTHAIYGTNLIAIDLHYFTNHNNAIPLSSSKRTSVGTSFATNYRSNLHVFESDSSFIAFFDFSFAHVHCTLLRNWRMNEFISWDAHVSYSFVIRRSFILRWWRRCVDQIEFRRNNKLNFRIVIRRMRVYRNR